MFVFIFLFSVVSSMLVSDGLYLSLSTYSTYANDQHVYHLPNNIFYLVSVLTDTGKTMKIIMFCDIYIYIFFIILFPLHFA